MKLSPDASNPATPTTTYAPTPGPTTTTAAPTPGPTTTTSAPTPGPTTTTTTPPTTTTDGGDSEECEDIWPTKRCQRRKEKGKCDKNFVAQRCQLTCGLCGEGSEEEQCVDNWSQAKCQ